MNAYSVTHCPKCLTILSCLVWYTVLIVIVSICFQVILEDNPIIPSPTSQSVVGSVVEPCIENKVFFKIWPFLEAPLSKSTNQSLWNGSELLIVMNYCSTSCICITLKIIWQCWRDENVKCMTWDSEILIKSYTKPFENLF